MGQTSNFEKNHYSSLGTCTQLQVKKSFRNGLQSTCFRLCMLSSHCPQVIRTSEPWGKPQTLKKIITQVRALAPNFRSKNLSQMDRRLPVLDFVQGVQKKITHFFSHLTSKRNHSETVCQNHLKFDVRRVPFRNSSHMKFQVILINRFLVIPFGSQVRKKVCNFFLDTLQVEYTLPPSHQDQ